jgi:hypothetical protein
VTDISVGFEPRPDAATRRALFDLRRQLGEMQRTLEAVQAQIDDLDTRVTALEP